MAIAKQLGYAETAFISESEIADYKIEYFTPKEEVDLCGHATIGSFAILMHVNKLLRIAIRLKRTAVFLLLP